MAAGSCFDVSRKEDTEGGNIFAILAILFSEMTPGPLGISETRPSAEAPYCMVSKASLTSAMQQILTLGFQKGFISASNSFVVRSAYDRVWFFCLGLKISHPSC